MQAAGGDDPPDERFGVLRLKRSNVNKTGYVGVQKTKSNKRPFQATVINKRTGKQQGIGSFSTAQEAAVERARALYYGEDENLGSPQKRRRRGAALATQQPATLGTGAVVRAVPACLPAAALQALAASGQLAMAVASAT